MMASLKQLVTSLTRPASGNISDILLCSDYYVDPTSVNVSPCPVATDNLGVCFDLPVSSPGSIGQCENCFFNFANGDYEPIEQILISTDWDVFFGGCEDADSMYFHLMDLISSLVEIYVPRKCERRQRQINEFIRRLTHQLSSCNPSDLEKLASLRRRLRIAVARRRAILEQSIAASGDSKGFFGYASERQGTTYLY